MTNPPQNKKSEGNNYDMSGDFRQSIVNVGATLTGVKQTVINNPTYIVHKPPPLWFGVPHLTPHFQGRDDLIADLVARLTSGQSLTLAAEGMPGVGKTAVTAALAHHKDLLAHFTDGVLWTGLGPRADVMSALGQWANELGVDETQLITVEQRQQAVRAAIGQRKLLLVIDDAWEIEAAEAMRCGGPNCVHLLTSRDKGLARRFAGAAQVINIPTLEDNPAFALLQTIAPEVCTADPETARQLVEAVGGLPLAIELLGSYLAQPERNLFPGLRSKSLAKMNDPQRRLQLAAARLGGAGQKVTLLDTIALSLDGLREMEQGEQAVAAFYALGAFAPKPEMFSVEAAKAVADCDEGLLALLMARNLVAMVDANGEWLALHQVVAEVARMELVEAAVERHSDYYLALVNEDREDWRRIGDAYGQIKWSWERLRPEVVLDYIKALRVYQSRQGLWLEYLSWAEAGLAPVQTEGDKEDERTLLNNIGAAYDSLGQWKRAIDYYRRSLAISEEVDDRAGLAATLNNIGGVYHRLGQQERALDYLQRSSAIREEVSDRAGLAATLNSIGGVYYGLGQREQAMDYFQWSLAIREEAGDLAGLAVTLHNIGGVYNSLGQWERAMDYYQWALPILEEVGDLAGLAATLNSIGIVYDSLGQREQAMDYFQWSLAISEEMGNQAGLAVTLHNIGSVYNSLGQRERALEYYQRALAISEEVGDRPGESDTRYNLAMLYWDAGQLAAAVAELERVVELRRTIQHPDLEDDMAMLARVRAELAAQQAHGE